MKSKALTISIMILSIVTLACSFPLPDKAGSASTATRAISSTSAEVIQATDQPAKPVTPAPVDGTPTPKADSQFPLVTPTFYPVNKSQVKPLVVEEEQLIITQSAYDGSFVYHGLFFISNPNQDVAYTDTFYYVKIYDQDDQELNQIKGLLRIFGPGERTAIVTPLYLLDKENKPVKKNLSSIKKVKLEFSDGNTVGVSQFIPFLRSAGKPDFKIYDQYLRYTVVINNHYDTGIEISDANVVAYKGNKVVGVAVATVGKVPPVDPVTFRGYVSVSEDPDRVEVFLQPGVFNPEIKPSDNPIKVIQSGFSQVPNTDLAYAGFLIHNDGSQPLINNPYEIWARDSSGNLVFRYEGSVTQIDPQQDYGIGIEFKPMFKKVIVDYVDIQITAGQKDVVVSKMPLSLVSAEYDENKHEVKGVIKNNLDVKIPQPVFFVVGFDDQGNILGGKTVTGKAMEKQQKCSFNTNIYFSSQPKRIEVYPNLKGSGAK